MAIECGNHEAYDSVKVALDHIYNLLVKYKLMNRHDLAISLVPNLKRKIL